MTDIMALNDDGTIAPPPPPSTPIYGYPLPETTRPVMDRDALGRYLLPHPVTGRQQSHTRMTTLVHVLDDDYSLSQWQRRQWATGGYVCGASHGHGAAEALMPWDTRYDRDKIADAAELAVDMGRAAEFGTAVHAWTEVIDRGFPLAVVPDDDDTCVLVFRDVDPRSGKEVEIVRTLRGCVGDYIRIRSESGLTPLPDHIERSVFRSIDTGIHDAAGNRVYVDVVGTYDRMYVDAQGRRWLGDVKTSKRLDYSYNSFSAQLEGYAGAPWVWEPHNRTWQPQDDVPIVGLVVMNVPSAPASLSDPITAGVRTLDRSRGAELLQLAARMRVERRMARARDLSIGPELVPPAPAEALRHRLIGMFQNTTTPAEAAALYETHAEAIASAGLLDWVTSLAGMFPRA